jgi:histidinol dehydrogenase
MDSVLLKVIKLNSAKEIIEGLTRPGSGSADALKTVEAIVGGIKRNGDAALYRFIKKYDGFDAGTANIRVAEEDIGAAAQKVKKDLPDLVKALDISRRNIESFHRSQYEHCESSWMKEDGRGARTGQKVTPLERVGLYIPGGRYAYPSTLLMTSIPAITAGVDGIAVCSPPDIKGDINPVMLYLCSILGISEIYRMGGAQAIAAMAFGTASVKKVDKIAGPGNIYVTLAKKMVYGYVGIDSLAGPSDITIIADGSASPELAAADMLSQAEHDPLSRTILLSSDRELAEQAAECMHKMLRYYGSCKDYAGNFRVMAESIKEQCRIYYSPDIDVIIEAANMIAPEHLEIMVGDPDHVLEGIRNAGAIFIGDNTPVAVGDYIGGTNHVIPTEGNARFSSPLGVGDFLKRSSICAYSRAALEAERKYIEEMAGFERLYVHRDSVRKRFERQGQ